MRELIVIPSEGKNSQDFLRKQFLSPKMHIEALNEYIVEHKINLDPETSIYIQGVLMAMFNYCVITISDYSMTAYIPRVVSKAQYSWFDENIQELSKYTISAEIMDKDEGIIQINRQASPGVNPIARFYSLLEKNKEKEVEKDEIPRSKQIC